MNLASARSEIRARPGLLYVYVMSRPDGQPFYVGMGSSRRIAEHEKRADCGWRGHKYAIIRKIRASGKDVAYQLTFVPDRACAIAEERRLIALYGRADKKAGPLTNITDGGDGVFGEWKFTEARQAGSKRAAEKLRGRKRSAEALAKLSATLKGRPKSEEWTRKIATANKGKRRSEAARLKMSKAKLGHIMPTPTREALERWRQENPGHMSAKQKLKWQEDGHKEKMSVALKGIKRSREWCEQNRRRQIEKFADPEFRARWNAARLAGTERAKAAKQS